VSGPSAVSPSSHRPQEQGAVEAEAGRRVVVEISGDLDMSTGPALERRLAALVDQGPADVVLDLSRVSFIDSSGLSVLVVTLKRLRSRQGTLRLAGCQSHVQTVLDLTALSRVFFMYPTVEAALADPHLGVPMG